MPIAIVGVKFMLIAIHGVKHYAHWLIHME